MSDNQAKSKALDFISKAIRDAVAAKGLTDTNANILMPTKTFGDVLGEFDKITFEIIKIDSDPAHKEVYEPSGSGKGFALAKRPLEMIAAACAIIWDPRTTTNLESSARKSRAKATGAIRKPNGEWFPVTAEKTVDLDAIEEEQRIKAEEQADKDGGPIIGWEGEKGHKHPKFGKWKDQAEKQAAIDMSVRKSMVTYRKFKDERAETGAMERCIKKLLALKDIYTEEELSKPFAFPRIVLDVGKMLENPQTRNAATERMTGSVQAVFGTGAKEQAIDVTPERRALPFEADLSAEEPEDESNSEEDSEEPLFADEELPISNPPDPPETEEQKVTRLRQQLAIALESSFIGEKNRAAGRSWLANNQESKDPVKLAEKIDAANGVVARAKARKAGAA